MGIDGLYKFINKNISDVYNNVGIHEIRHKPCIIDGMQHIFSQLIYMRSRGKEVITEDGSNISHIYGLINSLTYYLKFGIIPIFIFDGKSPEIKKNKIEERKKNLKENLKKLQNLEKEKNNLLEILNNKTFLDEQLLNNINEYELDEKIINLELLLDNELLSDPEKLIDQDCNKYIFGTPPDLYNMDEEIQKINNIQDEYKKIYRKSIVLKDYYILDWILILEYLGLPVVKAKGEADPLCAYILKKNNDIFGIISDDSDMLIFGAPILMRKSINQQFTIIELSKLIENIQKLLEKIFNKNIDFTLDNLIDFSILLGTDYGSFKLNKNISDSLEILKYYIENDKIVSNIISENQLEYFNVIKNYYTSFEIEPCYEHLLQKPTWSKPKTLELKYKLLEFNVDEEYIDKNFQIINNYYNKFNKRTKKLSKYKFCIDNKNDYRYNNSENLFLISDVGSRRIKKNKLQNNINNQNNSIIDNIDLENIKNSNEESIFTFEK